ncbi:MAG: ankyrin repeat domain-containing protein, partial [Armatimonadota bacterium]
IALSDAVDNADVKAVERAFAGGAKFSASYLGSIVITCISEAYFPLRPDSDPKCERFRAIAKFLLRRGADPNQRDGNQGTALHHAAMNGDVEICTLLLDRKADPAGAADVLAAA